MNSFASIAFLVDTFYDKTYLDNQITGLVSTGYLNVKCTNSVDSSTNYYYKIETGSLLANSIYNWRCSNKWKFRGTKVIHN